MALIAALILNFPTLDFNHESEIRFSPVLKLTKDMTNNKSHRLVSLCLHTKDLRACFVHGERSRNSQQAGQLKNNIEMLVQCYNLKLGLIYQEKH
jgi:hypothetical protein